MLVDDRDVQYDELVLFLGVVVLLDAVGIVPVEVPLLQKLEKSSWVAIPFLCFLIGGSVEPGAR